MANIHRKPIRATIPQQVRALAKIHENRRRRAAKHLPWSRMNDAARAIALRVIVEGQGAFK